MDKFVEVSEQEVRISFELNCKCRANVRLGSLVPAAPVAFKVQTSSPHKFLVNPPSGLIPPLSYATFQIILKPQSLLPPTYPRSPSDRFLIKTALAPDFARDSPESICSQTIKSWFSSRSQHEPTHDIKLKVAFVGPFLLRQAVLNGDINAVKNLIKRQKSGVSDLSSEEAESLFRVASESNNSNNIIGLLIGAGLRINGPSDTDKEMERRWASKGWTEIHEAVAHDRTDELSSLMSKGECGQLDCRDNEGQTPLHLAASKRYLSCAGMLVHAGADVDVTSENGQTALYRAVKNGDRRMVEILIEAGADPTICSAIQMAKDKEGLKEMVEILERGEAVLNCARQGDAGILKRLLQKGATMNFHDQYGLTASHVAAIKGYKDVIVVLIEHGADVEFKDREGHSALHLAVEGGDIDVVETLINVGGANVNGMTKRGATPLYLAKAMGYDDIAQLLLNSGAS